MNDQNLSIVFQNYISKFDEMNDSKHHETYKWEAVRHFQDSWDLEADDFAAMFKKSVGATDNLINNRIMQPTSGILELARQEPETVRTLFRTLFAADGGDLGLRQERAAAFVSEANQLLEKYAPGKWKFEQDMRTAILYLNLRYPDDNYIYKATPARTFGRCMAFGHEIGSGRDFRLSQYYHLCDWLAESIRSAPDLIAVHQRRLDQAAYADEQFHILAYDIIYCAQNYNLYGSIDTRQSSRKRPSAAGSAAGGTAESGRPNRRSRIQEEEQARILARQNRLDAVRAEIDCVSNRLMQLAQLPLIGLVVEHRKFGPGKIVDRQNDVITVRFAKGDHRFAIPCAFTDHFLSTADAAITQAFSGMGDIVKEQKRLDLERQLLQFESLQT